MQIGLGIGTTFRRKWVPPLTEQIRSLLFSASEQGAFYDPSDLSTLFQDAAGTVPVTAVEQPVGRMLDKSGRGNHATQATTTKRPVLSRRVNLLVNSEFVGYTDGSPGTPPTGWANATSTGQIIAAPVGVRVSVSDTRRSFRQTAALSQGTAIAAKVRVEVHSGNLTIITILANLQAYLSGTKYFLDGIEVPGGITMPTGVHDIVMTAVVSTGGSVSIDYGAGVQGNATGDVTIFNASLTLATDAHLPYQRVNTATDYDADPAKFPAYLRVDGVDDALQTGGIDFTGTDKMTVWAGVLRTSTSVGQEICGLTASPVNAGAFTLWASTGGAAGVSNTQAAFSSAISGSLKVASQTLTHNTQAVLNGYQNSTGVNVRLNSGAINTVSAIPVANFANAPIYIGSRAGTSNFFNGRLYSLIIRGAQSSLSQIEATEAYIKQKMRLP